MGGCQPCHFIIAQYGKAVWGESPRGGPETGTQLQRDFRSIYVQNGEPSGRMQDAAQSSP